MAEDRAPEHLTIRTDGGQHVAYLGDRRLDLTGTEYRLLECLMRAPEKTFTRQELVEAVIAGGAVVLERTIDQHVYKLRRKLRPLDVIHTVRGAGYRWTGAPTAQSDRGGDPASV